MEITESDVSSIFTLERKGQLSRDISVVTAVSAEYLNSLLVDIVKARNEAVELYKHIDKNNYELSTAGLLNQAEMIRQLYDNLASIKQHMLKNDTDMQIQLDKLNYYMYNSVNNADGFDIIGKVQKLVEAQKEDKVIENQTKQTLYKFNSNDVKVTHIVKEQSGHEYNLSNVFLLVQPLEDCTQEIIFSGKGSLGVYKEGTSSGTLAVDDYIEQLDGRSDATILIPCKNLDAYYKYDNYLFSSPNCSQFVVTLILHPVLSTQVVTIDNSTSSITDTVNVNISAYPSYAGYVDGAGTYDKNALVKITAKPYPGYEFCYWTTTGAVLSVPTSLTADSYRVRANVASKNIAVFKKSEIEKCVVTAQYTKLNDTISADISCNGTLISSYMNNNQKIFKYEVNKNEKVIMTYDIDPLHTFDYWTYSIDGAELSSIDNPLTFNATEDINVKLNIKAKYAWKYESSTSWSLDKVLAWKKSILSKGYNIVFEDLENVSSTYPQPTSIMDAMIITKTSGGNKYWRCAYACKA